MDVVAEDLVGLHVAHARWNVKGALGCHLVNALLDREELAVVPMLNLYELLVELFCL